MAAKYNKDYKRAVLEALEHKITPFVKTVKEHAEQIKKQGSLVVEYDTSAILKAVEKLEGAVTDLILKEYKKVREKDR